MTNQVNAVETQQYRFDGFNCWGRDGGLPETVQAFFRKMLPEKEVWFWGNAPASFFLDNWYRGVLALSDEQAKELEQLVEAWNAPDPDDEEDYNAYSVSFSPATGTEHVISVKSPNGHYNDSYQWS